MLRAVVSTCVFAGCVALVAVPLPAQQVIHALTGTVTTVDSADKTITVFQDDGGKGVLQDMTKKTAIAFDKRVAALTTAVDAFNKQGSYAIIFYFGDNDDRRVVAVKSLGDGPFASTVGTISRIDLHAHTISVEDKSGATQTFKIDTETVAEGGMGVVEGLKFQGQSGDRVRVVSSTVNGAPTALFIRQM